MTTPESADTGLLNDWYRARALVAAELVPAIVVALLDGPLNYSEVRQAVESCHVAEGWNPRHERLHESTLTRSLQQLTGDGLLLRQEIPGSFPRSVQYMLTPGARELVEAMRPVADWARQHDDLVEQARRRRWKVGRAEPDN